MAYVVSQNSGNVIQCKDWSDVLSNLTVYASPSDKVQAKSMLDAGCDSWNFVYGFSVDLVTKT